VFTWLVENTRTSTAVCILPRATRNWYSRDGNFTSNLWNFIGIHLEALYMVPFSPVSFRSQLHFASSNNGWSRFPSIGWFSAYVINCWYQYQQG